MTDKTYKISPERKTAGLTGISKTVSPLLRHVLGQSGLMLSELLRSWKDIIGKDLSPYCLPQSLRFKKGERTGGCLYLTVLSGAFAVEIQQKQQQIINNVNTFLGSGAISKLKITQCAEPENFLVGKKTIEKVKKVVVSPEEESYIAELTKDINNAGLRQTLENIGRAVYAGKDLREQKFGRFNQKNK